MVEAVREVEAALGDGAKAPVACEVENAKVARKSLVAARDLDPGEVLSAESLTAMRPGTGISPMRYWDFIGRTAGRGYRAGDLIQA
jgi:N-acetylneuraminate synthase